MIKESTIKNITITVIAGLIIAFICWLFTPLGDNVRNFFEPPNETSEKIIKKTEAPDGSQEFSTRDILGTEDTLEDITTQDTAENLDYFTYSIMERKSNTEDITIEDTTDIQALPTLIKSEYTADNQEYPVREIESNKFNFKVTNCELSGGLLTIELFITSIEKETDLTITDNSYFIGKNGNTYYVKRVRIGGHLKSRVNFLKDIPLKAVLEFEDIDTDLSGIKIFRLMCYKHDRFPVDFPDLYMPKKGDDI